MGGAPPRRRSSASSTASSTASSSTAAVRRRSSASSTASGSSRRSSGLRAEHEVRYAGTVSWFEGDFGFIEPDDGSPDVFVHSAAAPPGGLAGGDRVDFRIATFNGRDRAMDVARLDGDDDAATDDGAAPAAAFGPY